jgi:hypothetical protein
VNPRSCVGAGRSGTTLQSTATSELRHQVQISAPVPEAVHVGQLQQHGDQEEEILYTEIEVTTETEVEIEVKVSSMHLTTGYACWNDRLSVRIGPSAGESDGQPCPCHADVSTAGAGISDNDEYRAGNFSGRSSTVACDVGNRC